MKLFSTCLTCAVLSVSAMSAVAAESNSATSIPLTGFMAVSDEWNDDSNLVAYYGFYKFNSDGSGGISAVSPIGYDNTWANCGAVYIDGKYYCYNVSGSWITYTLSYYVIDASTWKIDTSAGFVYQYKTSTSEESQKAVRVPSAVVYDPVSDTIYAFTHKFGNSDSGAICRVDRETGELQYIADTPFIKSAATNASGVTYGIDRSGQLRKFDANWGNTVVGDLGMTPSGDSELNCGAGIDYRTNSMYWSLYGTYLANSETENGTNALIKVNLDDASAELLWNYPNSQRFTSISVQNSHPLAPDNLYDFTFTPETLGSNIGVIKFTVPSVTYSQTALTTDYECEIYVDSESKGTFTVTPGNQFSYTVEGLEDGNHTASVVLRANGHSSNVSYATSFFGVDTPQAVQDLTLSYDASTQKATLTWSMPDVGANGGVVDVNNVRYKITRYPDKTLVARSAKGTSYTEEMTQPFNLFYYNVVPYNYSNSSQQGKGANSNKVKMGAPRELPYSETFDTESSLDAYTLIDANGDGSDEWEAPCWKYDSTYACAFYYGKADHPADDWLITPAFNLNPDKLYKLTFKYYAYYGYGSRFRVVCGSEPTVEGMTSELLDKSTYSSFSDLPGITETVLFCPLDGEQYIGFHHLSTTQEHLSIDDIEIVEYMDATVPAAVEDLTATEDSDTSVKVAFTLPTLSAGHKTLVDPLTVYIYKTDNLDTPAATFTGKNPGDAIEWIDENAVKAKNEYIVYASNKYGNGLENSVSIDLSTGIPQSVSLINATAYNDDQVLVEWTPVESEESSDGLKVNLETIRYNVYKQVSTAEGTTYPLIARDLTDLSFIDNNPNDGYTEPQNLIAYFVTPVNEAGEGTAEQSNALYVGKAYSIPFAESWQGQVTSTGPWTKSLKNNATWYMRSKGYDPMVESYDGSGVYDCETDYEQTDGTCGLETPRIDFTTAKNPVLTFYMYRAPSYDSDVKLMMLFDDGDYFWTMPGNTFSAYSETEGWEKITVDLSNYTKYNNASLVFYATVKEDNTIHIDNVQISGEGLGSEIAATALRGNVSGRSNEEAQFTATVKNTGTTTLNGATVEFFVDSKSKETKEVASLAPNEEAKVIFRYTPADKEAGVREIKAVVSCESDENEGNNTQICAYEVKKQNYPFVTTLSGTQDYSVVYLKWGFPDKATYIESVLDDVEAYDNFSIENPGAWTLYDGDGGINFRFQDSNGNLVTWPNYDQPQAFMVFDPSELGLDEAPFEPYSGSQSFISWSCATSSNNDWLISPELSGDAQLISFYARSAVDGSEPFYLQASSNSKDPSDFIKISGATAKTTSTTWTAYRFALPEGTKYFAINYVGNDGYGLLVDDIIYDGYPLAVRPDGYNIYRNGEKINDELVTERRYTDRGLADYSSYTYTVAPVYNGIEAKASNEFKVETAGVQNVTADADGAIVKAEAGKISISNGNGRAASIYTASGVCVAAYNSVDEAEVNVAAGVYIVKVADKVVKLIVK